MEYLENKLGPIASNALSGINELRNKQSRQDNAGLNKRSADNNEIVEMTAHDSAKNTPNQSSIRRQTGMSMGGESSHNLFSPPPIGFRTDIFHAPHTIQHQDKGRQEAFDGQKSGSDASLYQGDGWARLWFQRVLLISLTRLLLFIRKIYEDLQSTKTHTLQEQAGQFLIAATALFMPTIVYTIYRTSWYLQLALPAFRKVPVGPQRQQLDPLNVSIDQTNTSKKRGPSDDDAQLTQALMSSPVPSSTGLRSITNSPTQTVGGNEDDGLVTARQSPNQEDFQDSRLESAVLTVALRSPSSANNEDHLKIVPARSTPKLESVDIDKLGDLPDKEAARVVIGFSEQLLHGVLYIFWQLKRQVDVMGYLVERACLWRKPRESERQELNRLSISSDHLEWFEDFYAAFLAIIIEVYKLGIYWSVGDNRAMTSIGVSSQKAADSSDTVAIKEAARLLASAAAASSTNSVANKDLLVMSQLIVSTMVVASLLVAVRRRDDGILHIGLSMIGWGSLFSARIIVIAMAFVHIGWYIILPFVFLHVIGITAWIYKIAIDSHNDMPTERVIEAMYDERIADEIEAFKQTPKSERDQLINRVTSTWSILEHLVLLTQIFFLFAIPSLFYWPIMFNLKTHKRLFKYLLIILTQNFILIPWTWYMIANTTPGQLYLLGAVAALSVVGFVFLSIYYCLKPLLTECFAQADMKFNQAETCGIYYEFCSRVFKLPDLSKLTFTRLQNQTEQTVEEQTIVREIPLDD